MERIYLDYAAATPLDNRVLQAMMPFFTTQYGNPSSLHYFGQQARSAVQRARQQVAHCLGVQAADIVFTSGGTEADNLAICGYLRANVPHGGHIITSAVEHPAVLRTFKQMEHEGFTTTVLPVDEAGRICPADVEKAVRDTTVFISIMYANNETGTIQPIKEIGSIARSHNIIFHVDAVQAFGYLPISPKEENIDLLTVCSHKIYGPKGAGALYIRHGLKVAPEAYGGPQEHQLRAGTENVPAIVGFGKAAELLESERGNRAAQVQRLKTRLYQGLAGENSQQFHLNGTLSGSLPNILNVSGAGIDRAVLLIALDRYGVAVSAGSACEAGAIEASHVLKAMGIADCWLNGSIRFSMGKDNSPEQIDQTIRIIRAILQNQMKKEISCYE